MGYLVYILRCGDGTLYTGCRQVRSGEGSFWQVW